MDNLLVAGEPGVRFYAGFRCAYETAALARFAWIDYAPREFSATISPYWVTWARWLRMSLPPSARRPRMS